MDKTYTHRQEKQFNYTKDRTPLCSAKRGFSHSASKNSSIMAEMKMNGDLTRYQAVLEATGCDGITQALAPQTNEMEML